MRRRVSALTACSRRDASGFVCIYTPLADSDEELVIRDSLSPERAAYRVARFLRRREITVRTDEVSHGGDLYRSHPWARRGDRKSFEQGIARLIGFTEEENLLVAQAMGQEDSRWSWNRMTGRFTESHVSRREIRP